jgi:3-methylcrotonyl-CoA carboxylase beta subunit
MNKLFPDAAAALDGVLKDVHRKAAKWHEREDEGNLYYATGRLWDNGVIDPAQTRDVLALTLEVCSANPIPERPVFGVSKM